MNLKSFFTVSSKIFYPVTPKGCNTLGNRMIKLIKFIFLLGEIVADYYKAYKCFSGNLDSSIYKVSRWIMNTLPLDRHYHPSEDEEFMNPHQREYFKRKLEAWRDSLLQNSTEALQHLSKDTTIDIDLNDRASSETDRAIELRTHDRARKLLIKIEHALQKIENGSYGYCEVTGEPISLKRLEARPIATLSIEAQEQHERKEKIYRDDQPVD